MTPPSHGLRQVKDAPMTRLVVVDDQAMIRAGFRSLLNAEADLEVVGEAANGQEAIDIVGRLRPDVTLMDIRMPVLDGLAATQAIMGAGMPTRVLMLTTFALDEYVFDALRAGASGFLLKDASAEELAAAIRVVAAGDSLLAPAVTRQVIDAFVGLGGATARRPDPRLGWLTPRELEVLALIARGNSNADIATRLFISEATTKTHVSNLLAKLELRDRVQAVIFAYENGVAVPGENDREPDPRQQTGPKP
jgi:DNA-binding NarL/FixJ family response regulator